MHLIKKLSRSIFICGIASFFWLLLRTGTKPSRIAYPCQKAAASQSILVLAVLPHLVRQSVHFVRYRFDLKKLVRPTLLVALIGAITICASVAYDRVLDMRNGLMLDKISHEMLARSRAAMEPAGAAAAISSPHRVVMVHSDDAASWHGQSVDYWNMIDQAVVDEMVSRGLKELTGTTSVAQAWQELIPNYQPHQKIAIKINNNNAGTYESDWGKARGSDIDAIIEPVNSIAKSLMTAFGSNIAAQDIWVYESYRCFYGTTFINRAEPGIRFFSAVEGPPASVTLTGFSGTAPNSMVHFRYNPSLSLPINDVVVSADYLINIPIVKKHGNGSATLGFKNHYGSIEPDGGRFFSSSFHDARFLRTNNDLVDINNNPHIRDKTVLVLGDAIIGTSGLNYTPPELWTNRFPSQGTPEMLFFSADPVAADSVMADLLLWEKGSEDVANTRNYLLEAMDLGLGVAEVGTWSGTSYPNVSISYHNIDFVHVDLAAPPPSTYYVPDDYSTIQQALDASTARDTIIVRDGIYSGSGNKNLDFHGKAVTLRSQNGPANCVIDCGNSGGGFVFYSGESFATVVKGFTIINGNTSYGGGMYCVGSSPTIAGCVISSNTAAYGGGVCLSNSSARITNCTITGNAADQGAGGIYCYNSHTTISHCTVSDNSAVSGAGIFCYIGSVTIANCIMTNDSATYGPELLLSGGAVVSVGYSDIEGGRTMAYVEAGSTLNWGAGNIASDPQFIGGGDYHLKPFSPCVDAGANIGVTVDVDGDARPYAAAPDMGSDECTQQPQPLSTITLVSPPNGSVLTSPPTLSWSIDGGSDNTFAVDFSFTYPISAYWSTFENMGLQIRDTSWTMPASVWNQIPSGSFVYWKARGADLARSPLTVVYSGGVYWFYKP